MGNRGNGYFIFQQNSLLVPEDTPDSQIHKTIDPEKTSALLGNFPAEETDSFSIPPLENGPPIIAVMLGTPARGASSAEPPVGWKQIPVRQALSVMNSGVMVEGAGETGRLLRAYHIGQWRKDSRFCGACGSRNTDDAAETARKCPSCGRMEFPRIAPAVITVIVNDRDEALLAHNKKFASKTYALIAGFNEAGESLEATVAREIREEVSIEVRDIRYICSQPWPFPNSLMLGFYARHESGEIRPDGSEIIDARWFSRDNLPLLPLPGSVSRHLIDLWLQKKLT